jgi:hypothetical protein
VHCRRFPWVQARGRVALNTDARGRKCTHMLEEIVGFTESNGLEEALACHRDDFGQRSIDAV